MCTDYSSRMQETVSGAFFSSRKRIMGKSRMPRSGRAGQGKAARESVGDGEGPRASRARRRGGVRRARERSHYDRQELLQRHYGWRDRRAAHRTDHPCGRMDREHPRPRRRVLHRPAGYVRRAPGGDSQAGPFEGPDQGDLRQHPGARGEAGCRHLQPQTPHRDHRAGGKGNHDPGQGVPPAPL